MSHILYIDAPAGLAGDMLAGAFFDLGWPLQELEELIAQTGLPGVRVSAVDETRSGMAAKRLQVEAGEDQPHRHLSQVKEILAKLPPRVAEPAGRVFDRLAQAEAAVHGISVEKVHFHEVGAIDAIVDVTAFCAGLNWLGADRVICSPLPLGRGFVNCAHGRIPLPAPAVLKLLEGLPTTSWPGENETVTPTGAALVSTLAHEFGALPAMSIKSSGCGAGTYQGSHIPNLVRMILGRESGKHGHGDVVEIVCNLDDMNPEDLPLAIERLLAAGALDAYAAPIYMKKGRPGLELVVIARPGQARELSRLVLEQTSSLGVRLRDCSRHTLEREIISLESPWGTVRVKKARIGGDYRYTPEADDVMKICRETGLTPLEVRQKVMELIKP